MCGQSFTDLGDFAANLLHLAASLFQGGGYAGVGFLALLLQTFKFLLGGDDLTLPCIVLFLCDGAVFQARVHLILHGF